MWFFLEYVFIFWGLDKARVKKVNLNSSWGEREVVRYLLLWIRLFWWEHDPSICTLTGKRCPLSCTKDRLNPVSRWVSILIPPEVLETGPVCLRGSDRTRTRSEQTLDLTTSVELDIHNNQVSALSISRSDFRGTSHRKVNVLATGPLFWSCGHEMCLSTTKLRADLGQIMSLHRLLVTSGWAILLADVFRRNSCPASPDARIDWIMSQVYNIMGGYQSPNAELIRFR